MRCSPFNPCGCGINTCQVCGEFDTPTTPDEGRCHPYRVKTDCEAPVLPQPECEDDEFSAEYDPNNNPPFTILARLFDQDCNVITDEDGNPILTVV